MKRLYLLSYIIILIQISPQECIAALMVKEAAKSEHVSTISLHNHHKKKVVYKKKQKRKRGFRKKWRSFWKKLKVKFKSIGKNKKKQKVGDVKQKVEPFSLLSFIFSLSFLINIISPALTLITILCFLSSPIFAFVGLKRIKKNPDRYIGKGFAICAIIIFSILTTLIVIELIKCSY